MNSIIKNSCIRIFSVLTVFLLVYFFIWNGNISATEGNLDQKQEPQMTSDGESRIEEREYVPRNSEEQLKNLTDLENLSLLENQPSEETPDVNITVNTDVNDLLNKEVVSLTFPVDNLSLNKDENKEKLTWPFYYFPKFFAHAYTCSDEVCGCSYNNPAYYRCASKYINNANRKAIAEGRAAAIPITKEMVCKALSFVSFSAEESCFSEGIIIDPRLTPIACFIWLGLIPVEWGPCS